MSITRRPAVPTDAAALAQLYTAYDTAELGEPEIELSEIEGFT